MRFCIECSRLTDEEGKGVPVSDPNRVSHSFVDAESAAEAISACALELGNELGRIHRVGEIQAAATVRNGKSAMTLHAFPEEEAVWRIPEDNA